jgi:uncharacterized integral membrane protein
MTDDPTRATARPGRARPPTYGSVGPEDPRADPVTLPVPRSGGSAADPATDPNLRPVGVPEAPTVPIPGPTPRPVPGAPSSAGRSRTGGLWTGLILSAVVLLFLLIFILQNNAPVQINFLAASGTLPTGVALLFAAIAGLLLVAIPGGLRILQLRRAARRR